MVEDILKERKLELAKRKILKEKIAGKTGFVIATIIVLFGAFTMIFPYMRMFLTALKTPTEAMSLVPTFFPKSPNWGIFTEALTSSTVNFMHSIGNTMIIELLVVIVGTFVSSLCAFAFAKMKFRFKKTILIILMTSMMIPYAAVMLPQYQVYMDLGITSSDSSFVNLLPLILPGLFGNISMTFFLITSMQNSIHDALIEESKIEGCSWFRTYRSIGLPLSKPAIAAQVIFRFVGIWNDYFAPSLYLQRKDNRTIQVALTMLNSSSSGSGQDLPLLFAAAFLSSIPMIILFIVCRKMFINIGANSGIKG
jgi:multiple sugar transport system permease protein